MKESAQDVDILLCSQNLNKTIEYLFGILLRKKEKKKNPYMRACGDIGSTTGIHSYKGYY